MMINPVSQVGDQKGSISDRIQTLIIAGVVVVFLLVTVLSWFYFRITKPIIDLRDKKSCFFYIPTGSNFAAVTDSLKKKGYLKDMKAFEWLARRKHYDLHVKPGRYRLLNGMHNNALVNLLRSGIQEPVRIIIQNVRTREELAGKIGNRLETDSAQLIDLFNDPSFLAGFDITPATLFVMFIPDTYEFYWNTSGDQLFRNMQQHYNRFWTGQRVHLADSLHLTISEVVTLASIVEKESNKKEEKPVIAGVYLNRLKKNIPLQADPTVIYAWNDYHIRRVMKIHIGINSPYNTYAHAGLPPGPICLPSVASVDAVLHAVNHSYIYFCAKEDLSGYHNFAINIEDHTRNARRYQKALDKINIR
jgi:UPF0755 protein